MRGFRKMLISPAAAVTGRRLSKAALLLHDLLRQAKTGSQRDFPEFDLSDVVSGVVGVLEQWKEEISHEHRRELNREGIDSVRSGPWSIDYRSQEDIDALICAIQKINSNTLKKLGPKVLQQLQSLANQICSGGERNDFTPVR